MSVVLRFPAEEVRERQRIEKLLRDTLEMHAPESREAKLQAIMEIYDRHAAFGSVSVTVENPPGGPFSERQTEAIIAGMHRLGDEMRKRAQNILTEVVLLKLQVIELEAALRR